MAVLSRYCKKQDVETSKQDHSCKGIYGNTELITLVEEDGDDDDDDGYDYAPAAWRLIVLVEEDKDEDENVTMPIMTKVLQRYS